MEWFDEIPVQIFVVLFIIALGALICLMPKFDNKWDDNDDSDS